MSVIPEHMLETIRSLDLMTEDEFNTIKNTLENDLGTTLLSCETVRKVETISNKYEKKFCNNILSFHLYRIQHGKCLIDLIKNDLEFKFNEKLSALEESRFRKFMQIEKLIKIAEINNVHNSLNNCYSTSSMITNLRITANNNLFLYSDFVIKYWDDKNKLKIINLSLDEEDLHQLERNIHKAYKEIKTIRSTTDKIIN